MHPTSTHWQQNQARQVTTEGFVELTFYVTDPNLRVSHIAPGNELTPVSQSQKIINQHPQPVTRFATLEPDLWLLDASRVTVPQTFPQVRPFGGFISNELCNASGMFSSQALIDIVLGQYAVILPGITIVWGEAFGEYPINFSVIQLGEDGREIGRTNITGNNSTITEVSFPMRRVHRIRLVVTRWHRGNRRARVGNIFLGHVRAYTKDNILAFASSQEVDPVSGRLPKYEISFELDNRNRDFDPLSAHSLYQFALERQEVTARYGFSRPADNTVEWIPGGQYFLTDWVASQNGLSASFKARDLLGALTDTYTNGQFGDERAYPLSITTPTSGGGIPGGDIPDGGIPGGGVSGDAPFVVTYINLHSLATAVLRDAMPTHLGSGEEKWVIHNSLRNIHVISPLPMATHAECLQLIANAAGAALTFDRNGILHIAPMAAFSGRTSRNLSANNTYSRPEFDIQRPVKSVEVSTYKWESDTHINTVLYDQELQLAPGRNEFIAEYSEPAVDIQVEHPLVNGQGNSVQVFARTARLIIHRTAQDPEFCRVTLRGRVMRPLESTTVVINNHNNPQENRGETMPLKNILLTDMRQARNVATALLSRYTHDKKVSVGWRVDPTQDMGDFIAIEGDPIRPVMQVLASDFRFSGAFIGKSEGLVIQ